MQKTSLRNILTQNGQLMCVHAADILSAPGRDGYLGADPFSSSYCSRALPMATAEDLVLLSGPIDQHYMDWLKTIEMGPGQVVSYNVEETRSSLAELVLADPIPFKNALDKLEKQGRYIPFYTSADDITCAEQFNLDLFGSDQVITEKHFNKLSFKRECSKLDIPLVEGSVHSVDSTCKNNYRKMEEKVLALLDNHERVIIRDTFGAGGGLSTYTTDSGNLEKIYSHLMVAETDKVIIEPFLEVISSPNDQWAIDSQGNTHHIGTSAQIFFGLKHQGNLDGQYYSERTFQYIRETSQKIVDNMAAGGYVGVVGLDYIVCENGIFPIENNARMNGSTYAYGIADIAKSRIDGISCWKLFKLKGEPCTFEDLRSSLEGLLFNNKRRNSIFPLHTERLPKAGTCSILILAEDIYHVEYLENQIKTLC